MRKYMLLFLLLALVRPFFPAAAQGDYSFRSLSLEQGLSQPNVHALLVDRRGFVWAGTASGLNRFGNRSVKVYTYTEGDAASLPDSRIEGLAEDGEGRIWVMTRRGLARYDRERDGFETLTAEPVWHALVLEDRVLFSGNACLYQIGYGDGAVLERIPLFDGADAGQRVCALTRLPDGGILAGLLDEGIYRCDPERREAVRFTEEARPGLLGLYADADGTVYASFFGDGVYRYGADGSETAHYTTANSGLANDYVQDFISYDGAVWMATDGGGISLFSPEKESFHTLRYAPGRPDSLPSDSVTLLYRDGFGNLWAGTVKRGFFRVRRNFIRTWHGAASGLEEDAVSTLFRDEDGLLWVGTDGGGIYRFDPQAGKCLPVPSTRGMKLISTTGYGGRQLLISVYTKGYFLLDKQTGRLRPFTVVSEEENHRMCFSGYLPRVERAYGGDYYFLGADAWKQDARTGAFSRLQPADGTVPTDRLQLSCSDARFTLFYRDSAVLVEEGGSGTLRVLCHVPGGAYVTSVSCDGQGSVWVGTETGLGRYDLETGQWQALPTPLFQHVTALSWDARGRLWICADNALFTLLPDGNFQLWGEADGFRPNFIKHIYQRPEDPDYLFFGGSGGLVRIERDIPAPDEGGDPLVFLDQVTVGGLPVTGLTEGGALRLKWDFGSVKIAFQARYPHPFQQKFFQFTIQGKSGETTYQDPEPELVLSALRPGTYRILVSCATASGGFSAPQEVLTLAVQPPWYGTAWFISLLLLSLIGAGVLLHARLRRRQERRNKDSMAGFLESVLTATGPETPPAQEPDDFLTRLDALIGENLSNPELDVQFLCRELPMSRTKLYDTLKQKTGLGVNDYINRIRIERSVELLLGTKLSINEIAYEVGFSYPRYFSTSFKHLKGVTPTRFKKEHSLPPPVYSNDNQQLT